MKNKAIVLAITFVALIFLVGLSTAIFSRSMTETNQAVRSLKSTQAFWIGEAGIQKALYCLNGNNWTGWSTDASGNKNIIESVGTLGEYSVDLIDPSGSNPNVSVIGAIPNHFDPDRIEKDDE